MQLFQNFLINALKYKNDERSKIHVSAIKPSHEWIFSVQDNGIGINPEHYNKIFALFQRLETKTEHSGTGIGLAICKKIIERHDGSIWGESVLGKGSIFSFALPEAIFTPEVGTAV